MSESACYKHDFDFKYKAPEGVSKNDASVLEALHSAIHLELFGNPNPNHKISDPNNSDDSFGHITDGKGPYDSIKCALPKISNEAASDLASMINSSTGKQVYRTGEEVNAPKDLSVRLNGAELRVGLGLPLSASQSEIEKAMDIQLRDALKR